MRGTPVGALQRRTEAGLDDTAFIAGEETWSYWRLESESERLASALLTRGIQAGDRIALHMSNRPELAIAYHACFRIGAIAAPLNIRLKTAQLRPMLQRLRPALYVGQDELYPQVAPVEPEFLLADARFIAGGPVEDGRARSWASLIADATEDGPTPHRPGPDAPAVLPLRRPSVLHSHAIVKLLLAHSGGVTRDLFRIVVHAAEAAVRSGAERIDAGLIETSARVERRAR